MKYNGAFNHMTGVYNTPHGQRWSEPKSLKRTDLEKEILTNRTHLRNTNDREAKRAYIRRNHELMTELDRRYQKAEAELLSR